MVISQSHPIAHSSVHLKITITVISILRQKSPSILVLFSDVSGTWCMVTAVRWWKCVSSLGNKLITTISCDRKVLIFEGSANITADNSLQSQLTANVSSDKQGWCLRTYTQYQKAVLCKHQSYCPTYEFFEVCDGLMLSSCVISGTLTRLSSCVFLMARTRPWLQAPMS